MYTHTQTQLPMGGPVPAAGQMRGASLPQLPEADVSETAAAVLQLFRPLSAFPELEAEWLIPGWIPKGQITVLASDGGIGKTSLWIHIIACRSAGRACILDPKGYQCSPMRIAFLTTEDSVCYVLKRRLRLAGANMDNIITMDLAADESGLAQSLVYGSDTMREVIETLQADLVVYDPLQGFLDSGINMGSRNAMRRCLAPLVGIGERVGTTFLLVCHTNKRDNASGRNRIADSADVWDIARSVIMMDKADEDGVKYISQEKNNYGPLQETVLYTHDNDGNVHYKGTTWKRDADYQSGKVVAKSAPKLEDCKAAIYNTLQRQQGHCMAAKELDAAIKQAGYSMQTFNRARKVLREEGKVESYTTGAAKDGNRVFYWRLAEPDDSEPLPF